MARQASKKPDEDHCGICGVYLVAACVGFRHTPWIDGRKYEYMCDCCRCSVKDDETCELRTWQEITAFGWDKETVVKSLKGIKLKLKNRKAHSA